MHERIEECEQADGAAIAKQIDAEKIAHRGDCKRDDEETQGPEAQGLLQRTHRIGAQLVHDAEVKRPGSRRRPDKMDCRVMYRDDVAGRSFDTILGFSGGISVIRAQVHASINTGHLFGERTALVIKMPLHSAANLKGTASGTTSARGS
jgi:hypothetical protein